MPTPTVLLYSFNPVFNLLIQIAQQLQITLTCLPITPTIHFQQRRYNLAERITLRVINRLRIAVTKLMQDIVQNQAKHLHPIKSRDFLILQHPALADKFPLA